VTKGGLSDKLIISFSFAYADAYDESNTENKL
jgi:hypothetical protein